MKAFFPKKKLQASSTVRDLSRLVITFQNKIKNSYIHALKKKFTDSKRVKCGQLVLTPL